MKNKLQQEQYRQELYLYFNMLREKDSSGDSSVCRYYEALLDVSLALPSPEREARFVEGILALQGIEPLRRAA